MSRTLGPVHPIWEQPRPGNSMLMVPADEHDSVTMSHTCDNY
jgi:hypothetical protein